MLFRQHWSKDNNSSLVKFLMKFKIMSWSMYNLVHTLTLMHKCNFYFQNLKKFWTTMKTSVFANGFSIKTISTDLWGNKTHNNKLLNIPFFPRFRVCSPPHSTVKHSDLLRAEMQTFFPSPFYSSSSCAPLSSLSSPSS